MKLENAIEVNNIRKNFKVYKDKGHTLKEVTLFSQRRAYEEREVLKGISFEVKKGEAVGLIGQNGCGKSTTLKLLTKIIYPDEGTIEMNGRVSSLIELGAGFHPDMSGKENIYINASIFGLTKKEIDAKLDDIISFSELENFIDNPVRTYSSGMYMRLAFAVAINVNADILLIDEILAVGDINFQSKCFNKLRELKGKGTTIVIVSHSMEQIEKICEKSIWIQEGLIKAEGSPRDVHPQYFEFMGKERQSEAGKNISTEEKSEVPSEETSVQITKEELLGNHWGTGEVRITEVKCYNKTGEESLVFKTGSLLKICVFYNVLKKVFRANIGIAFYRLDGVLCYGTNTQLDKEDVLTLDKDGKIELVLPNLELLPGEYDVDFAIGADNGIDVDYCKGLLRVQIYSDINDVGVSRLTHYWNYG